MRIYTDKITGEDLRKARFAAATIGDGAVFLAFDRRGSRKRAHAFEVRLYGDGTFSKRRAMTGTSGAGDEYATTWCAWGAFLAELFDVDPTAVAGPYNGREDFHRQTYGLFADGKRPSGHAPKYNGAHEYVKDGRIVARLEGGRYVTA